MSIASEITSMGENLKKDYQSIANLGADLTNVDKNIENIAELLDNVYDTLPKTSFQEGTEVTIENGLKGKIDFDDGKVGFGQASQETTTGINLLNYITNLKTNFQGLISQINDDGSITTTGTPTYNYTGIIDMMITDMLEIGQDYTISQKTANPYLYLQINAKNTQTSQESYYLLNNTTSRTFTAQANTTYVLRLQTPTTGGWGTDSKTITNFYQLEKGSTAHTFEKYTGGYASPSPNWEQPIQCVTGNQEIVESDGNNNSITYPISLGNNKFYSIGDYADELLYDVENDKVYKYEKIHKYEFTGQENFNRSGEYGGGYSFFLMWANALLDGVENAPFKCNIGTYISAIADYGVGKIFSDRGMAMNLYPSTEVTTVDDFKAKLQTLYNNGTPCYIVHQKATPELIELTDTTLKQQVKNWYYSQSFNGTTILESNGDLPMIIKVRALKGE